MPKESERVSASRTVSLDLRDHVEGIWDEDVPIMTHIVVELVGVTRQRLGRTQLLEAVSVLLARFDLTALANEELAVEFPGRPAGYTIVQVLGQSHIALHSWPQRGYLHIDLVACNAAIEAGGIRQAATDLFEPTAIRVLKLLY